MSKKYYYTMEEEIRLKDIAIGFDQNLTHKCSNEDVIEEFRAYFDSNEVRRFDVINLWFESEGKVYFLKIKPLDSRNLCDKWIVHVSESSTFSFIHNCEKNLLDEIEEQLKVYEQSLQHQPY